MFSGCSCMKGKKFGVMVGFCFLGVIYSWLVVMFRVRRLLVIRVGILGFSGIVLLCFCRLC